MKLKVFIGILSLFAIISSDCFSATARKATTNKGRVGMISSSSTLRSGSTSSSSSSNTSSAFANLSGSQKTFTDCMDKLCNFGKDKGYRCGCSSEYQKLDSMIDEIKSIQSKAEKTASEDVERAKMGAKADIIFGSDSSTSSNTNVGKIDMSIFDNDSSDNVFASSNSSSSKSGDELYSSAYNSCKSKASGNDLTSAKIIYDRQVAEDCETYSDYLESQKKVATDNLATAEKMVRQARYEMLDTTNKYNRGECLTAYKDCVATKGGCGEHFENCLDKDLLERRANSCSDITDQCLAVREYVKSDFQKEIDTILTEANKYADENKRLTCFAKIESCLETGCTPSTNSACLNDVSVAKNVCPIISECEKIIPGIADAMESKLGYLRIRFCQQEAESCFKDKCGSEYTNPECVGKSGAELEKLCPQKSLVSCNGISNYASIRSAVFLKLDYQLLQGCVNYFSSKLSDSCGLDMSCITDNSVDKLTSIDEKFDYEAKAKKLVDEFFRKFEKDSTIDSCEGKVGSYVFETAKFLAQNQVQQNLFNAYTKKIASLVKQAKVEDAQKACNKFKNEYGVKTVNFDEYTRLCQITRVQADCKAGGQTMLSGILKGNVAGSVGGAGLGTSISPGWGTLIGAGVGGTVGAVAGGLTSKQIDYCTEVPVKQEIQM